MLCILAYFVSVRSSCTVLNLSTTLNDLAPEYLQSLFFQRHSAYNLLEPWGKADPVQTKHQLFETKLLLQRGHVME